MEVICYSGKIDIHFYKEITNSDFYVNLEKNSSIKELVQDPFTFTRDNALHNYSQQTREWIKIKIKENLD